MRQAKQYPAEIIGTKIWMFISKPFQITKVLELLYMLDWIWYAILSFLPIKFVDDAMFKVLLQAATKDQVSAIMVSIALSHVVGLFYNIVWLRGLNLLLNIAILLYLAASAGQAIPIPANTGYFIILIGITAFAFWRMDDRH